MSVLVSRNVGPAVVGVLDPAIVIPEWVVGLDSSRRRLVLAHESEHLRSGDSRLLMIALICCACMPWNLPLWWQLRRLRHAVELDCDARVVAGTGESHNYGELLVEVGRRMSLRPIGLALFGESSFLLEDRIQNILAPPPRGWRALLGGMLSLALIVLVAACESPTPVVSSPDLSDLPDLAVAPGPENVDVVLNPGAGATADSTAAADEPVELITDRTEPDTRDATAPAATPQLAVVSFPVEIRTQGGLSAHNIAELVRYLHPEVHEGGIPLDQALWIAVDDDSRIRKSWVGPNLYMNYAEHRPISWLQMQPGSLEMEAAIAAQRRDVEAVLADNVPELTIRSRTTLSYPRPHRITVQFVSERAGRRASADRGYLDFVDELVVLLSEPIASVRIVPLPVVSIAWQGASWSSVPPSRVIARAELEAVGEVNGTAIFVEANGRNESVLWELVEEPDIFLPYQSLSDKLLDGVKHVCSAVRSRVAEAIV